MFDLKYRSISLYKARQHHTETRYFSNILEIRSESHPADFLRALYFHFIIIKTGSICRPINILTRPLSLIKESPSAIAEFRVPPRWLALLTRASKRTTISITRHQNIRQRSKSIIDDKSGTTPDGSSWIPMGSSWIPKGLMKGTRQINTERY